MASNRAIADGQRIGAYRKRCQTHNHNLNKRKNRDSNTLEFMGILPEETPSKSLRREPINLQKKDDSLVKLRASICDKSYYQSVKDFIDFGRIEIAKRFKTITTNFAQESWR